VHPGLTWQVWEKALSGGVTPGLTWQIGEKPCSCSRPPSSSATSGRIPDLQAGAAAS